MLVSCPNATKCINFRIALRQTCDLCGKSITGNHLHDLAREFRLCDFCAHKIIKEKKFEMFRPHKPLFNEEKPCLRYADCFQDNIYRLFKEKICVSCRGDLHHVHYHDVKNNVRFCLSCFKKLCETS